MEVESVISFQMELGEQEANLLVPLVKKKKKWKESGWPFLENIFWAEALKIIFQGSSV